MFCNKCGKENSTGTRFCSQCGAPLQAGNEKQSGHRRGTSEIAMPNIFKTGLKRKNKKIILICLFLVLVLIAGYNIVRIWFDAVSVDVANEYQLSNIDDDAYETNTYIYYINDNSLYRVNKESKKSEKVTNRSGSIITGSSNGIYYVDSNDTLYEILDEKSEPEKILELKDNYGKLFLRGKYQYRLHPDSTIVKRLNSEKFGAEEMILYHSDSDDNEALKSVQYDEYIYMCVYNSQHDSNEFIRVSLVNGKKDVLSKEDIKDFAFTEKNIICLTEEGAFIKMDLDGGNAKEYTQIDATDADRLFCSGDYVYYSEYDDLYNFKIEGGTSKELKDIETTKLNGMISGLVNISLEGLSIYDHNGKVISEIES